MESSSSSKWEAICVYHRRPVLIGVSIFTATLGKVPEPKIRGYESWRRLIGFNSSPKAAMRVAVGPVTIAVRYVSSR